MFLLSIDYKKALYVCKPALIGPPVIDERASNSAWAISWDSNGMLAVGESGLRIDRDLD